MKSLKKSILAATFVMAAFASQAQLKVGSNPTAILNDVNLDVEATDGARVVVSKSSGMVGITSGRLYLGQYAENFPNGVPYYGIWRNADKMEYGAFNEHNFHTSAVQSGLAAISIKANGELWMGNGYIHYKQPGGVGVGRFASGIPYYGVTTIGSTVRYGAWDGHYFHVAGFDGGNTPAITIEQNGSVGIQSGFIHWAQPGPIGVGRFPSDVPYYGIYKNGSIVNYGAWDGHAFYVAAFNSGNQAAMFLSAIGNLGIGITNPSEKLHVAGNILASGTITPSDARFKENVVGLNGSLNKLTQLRGVSYTHKAEFIKDRGLKEGNQIGFIAQELEQIFPEFVVTSSDGYKAVDYARLTPVLVESLKEVNAKLEAQQAEINELKAAVNALLKK